MEKSLPSLPSRKSSRSESSDSPCCRDCIGSDGSSNSEPNANPASFGQASVPPPSTSSAVGIAAPPPPTNLGVLAASASRVGILPMPSAYAERLVGAYHCVSRADAFSCEAEALFGTEMDTDEFRTPKVGFTTTAIHSGQEPERWSSRAVVPPIVTATSYKQLSPYGEEQEFVYGRSGNPTRTSLECCLAALEGAKFALCFASGMGAISAIVSLLNAGDHLLTSGDIYGGTTRLFRNVVSRMGIEITYIDFTDLDSVKRGLKKNTKMIWLESPSNPLMKVVDIKAVVTIARTQKDIIIVADNTFLTPYFQRPLDLGVDIAMYSVTKYINGHADVIMGSAATNDPDLAKRLAFLQKSTGIVPSPFDCYLVNRSLKTLALRLDKHRKNSLAVAEWLAKHPSVVEVMHPELPTHPQLAITKKQTTGHSGVFSFRHNGGMKETGVLLSSFHVFTLAESLGGYESLAALPCTMSHGSLPEKLKQELGLTHSLIRLSIGLEDIKDLIADLEQAFNKAFKSSLPLSKI